MSLNKAYVSSTQTASSTPFDPTTNDGFIGSDVQAALQELRNYTVYDSDTTATTTNGTLTLSSPIAGGQANGASSQTMQFLTGSATGYSVQLPSATTLSISAMYIIANTSSQDVTIKDGSGATLFILGQTSIGYCYLQLNPNAAGTWLFWQIVSGIADIVPIYKVTSNTTFATSASVDTLITGMTITPVAGTYAIWYSSTNTGSGAGEAMVITIYAGATALADSVRTDSSPSGGHIFSQQTLTTHVFDGVTACNMLVNANGNSMTVNGRTMLLMRLGV